MERKRTLTRGFHMKSIESYFEHLGSNCKFVESAKLVACVETSEIHMEDEKENGASSPIRLAYPATEAQHASLAKFAITKNTGFRFPRSCTCMVTRCGSASN